MDKKIKVMNDLENAIEENVKTWNTAFKSRKLEDMLSAQAKLDEDIKAYATTAQALAFHQLKVEENPVLSAIKRFEYTVLAVKDEKADTGIITKTVIERSKQLDLLKFDKFCEGDNIMHDNLWSCKIEKFNQLMCIRAARELKIDPKTISNSFAMSKVAEEIKLGATPDSNTKILALLGECINSIIYEEGEHGNIYKATSKDVAFLVMVYTKKGKNALTIATAKHAAMRGYIMEILHRIVTEKDYSIDFKAKKIA